MDIKYRYSLWHRGIFSFWESFFSGFISIGNVIIFGANAMNWTVQISTKKYGYICFTLPVLARWRRLENINKKVFRWYFYCSPDGTPSSSTYYIGSNKWEGVKARIRKLVFGHNWRGEENRERNYILMNNFDWQYLKEYDLESLTLRWKNYHKCTNL